MNYLRRLSFERKTVALFVLLVAVTAAFFPGERRNVYHVYDVGTRSVIIGMNPYPSPGGQGSSPLPIARFDCSPTFAYFFAPFSTHHGLGPEAGGYAWVMLNLLTFMAGVWALFSLVDGEKKLLRKRWFLLSLLLLAGEMPGSIMNGYSNALITGMMMAGAGLYMRGYKGWAALVLAAGTNFKLFPLMMALFLGLDFGIGFISGFAVIAGLFFLLPVPIMGSASYGTMLASWYDIVVNEPLNTSYLGLEPTLLHYGFHITSAEFAFFMLANATALALASFHLLRKDRGELIRLIMPALLGFVVLFDRWAESQSFITITPVFIFILHAALRAREEGDDAGFRANILFIVAGWVLIWWGYSPFSSRIFNVTAAMLHFKTLGAVLMYLWAWARIVIHFADKMQAEGTVIPVTGAAQ